MYKSTEGILETKRTILCHLTPEDAAIFYLLNLNPDVLKFTGDVPFQSIEEARIFLKNYDQYERYGVGRLAVIEKESNKFIGWCGLKYSPEKREYDLGFRFFQSFWKQGFATETALACINYGFNAFSLPEIIGRAMTENIASVKVLEKIGMKFRKDFDFDGKKGVIFSITKSEFYQSSLS